MKESLSKRVRILIYVLLPLLILAGLLTGAVSRLSSLSSDIFYLVGLYRDFFVDHYDVSGWHLTPAPYVFPDMALFIPLLLAMSDIGYAFTLYAVVFFAVLVATLLRIGSSLTKDFFTAFAYTCSAALLFVVLIQESRLSELFLLPTVHGGAMLVGLIMLAIVLEAVRDGFSYISGTGLCLISFLGILSDLIVIPQFVLPLVAAVGVLAILRAAQFRLVLITGGIMLAATLLSSVTIRILETIGLTFPFSLLEISVKKSEASFAAFAEQVKWFVGSGVIFCVIFCLWLVVSIGVIVHNRHRFFVLSNDKKHEDRSGLLLLFVIIFSFFSISAAIAAPIVAGEDWFPIRHMQPIYCLPLFVVAFSLVVYSDRLPRLAKAVGLSAIVVLALFRITPQLRTLKLESLKLPHPEYLRCLDDYAKENGLRFGYGDYWSAKHMTFLSRSGLRVNQLKPNLDIFVWINNPLWYVQETGTIGGKYPEYGFIITEYLDKEKMKLRFGRPAAVKNCAGVEIYVYNRETDVAFRNFLRIPAIIAAGTQMPASPTDPQCLGDYKENGSAWNAPGNAVIPGGGELSVLFGAPTIGDVMEIAADEDEYEIDFYLGEEALGTMKIARTPNRGIQTRYLALPDSLAGNPFDKLVIRALKGDGQHGVGHIFVYTDTFGQSGQAG